jgi:hypothetical protein
MLVKCGIITFKLFLSEDIERIQKRALMIIVPSSSYGEALKITGITTLYDRRESLCDQFSVDKI